jgi:outer membrane protein
LLLCTGPAATHVYAEGLWDSYQLARNNDPAYRAAQLTYEADQQRLPQARAPLLPTLSGNAARVHVNSEFDYAGDQTLTSEGKASFYRNDYDVTFAQTLYDHAKLSTYRQAKTQLGVAELQRQIAEQELLLRVTARYFGVLAARDNLDLAVAEREALSRQLELAQARLTVGLGTKTDLYDAQARFKFSDAQVIAARATLDDALRALAEVTGSLPAELRRLRRDPTGVPVAVEDRDAWVNRALHENLDLRVAREQERVLQQDISVRNAGHYPFLDFVLRHGNEDATGSIVGPSTDQTVTEALVQLTVPILQGGAVVAGTREAQLRYAAAQHQTEVRRRSVERDTVTALVELVTGIEQIEALRQAVIAGEGALEAKQEGFAAGLETNIDVLNAQRDLFRARRDHLKSRYDYVLNTFRLQRLVGALGEADVQRVDSWLE